MEEVLAESKEELIQLGTQIWEKPELRFEEHTAHELLTTFLEAKGFTVERGYCGLATAFRARFGSGRPNVCITCEYDALPGIGHACGHNLIAESSIAAALGVKAFLQSQETGFCGSVTVIGTPAEEEGGGKIVMIEKGGFQDIDLAVMAHPGPFDLVMPTLLCNSDFEVTFKGKAAHAAAFPWEGINALDAAVLAYTNISALRQQMKPTWRVHGVFTDGGVKPNIIPERASLHYRARAPTRDEMYILKDKLVKCFQGAAQSTGCEFDAKDIGPVYEDLRSNEVLADIYMKQLELLGMGDVPKRGEIMASTDMGNLSYVVPLIHPNYSIGSGKEVNHSREFTGVTNTRAAHEKTLLIGKALAMTCVNVLLNKENCMKRIQESFQKI